MGIITTIAVIAATGYIAFGVLHMIALRQQTALFVVSLWVYLLVRYRRQTQAQPAPTRSPIQQPIPQPTHYHHIPVSVPPEQVRQAQTPHVQPAGFTDEQIYINALLKRKGIYFRVASKIETPDYWLYMLDMPPSAQFSSLRSYLSDLAREIYRYRSERGEPVSVVLNEQPAYLRVTAPERKTLSWSMRSQENMVNVAQIGAYWTHSQPTVLKINFADQKQWSVGIFSGSGGGKSMLLKATLFSLLESCPPGATEFYIIDLDSNQYDPLAQLPQVRCVASTEEQAYGILKHLNDLVEADRDMSNIVRRFLVVDELQILTEESDLSDEINEFFKKLADQGRKHLVNLVLATQDPTGKNYPTALQRNTKVVLAGLTADDSYLVRFLKVEGANSLRGDGDFIYRSAGQQVNFKGFLLTKEDEHQMLGELIARWGRDNSTIEFTEEPEDKEAPPGSEAASAVPLRRPPAKPPRGRERVAQDAQKLLPYLVEALDESGQLGEGWATTLIEVLYGEPKPNSGGWSTRLRNAVDYAKENLL